MAALQVWACNWPAVEVYQRCRLEIVAGGFSVHYNGIAPAEIRAALDLLDVPRPQWPDLLDDVQYMGRCASDALNARLRDNVKS